MKGGYTCSLKKKKKKLSNSLPRNSGEATPHGRVFQRWAIKNGYFRVVLLLRNVIIPRVNLAI